MSDAAVESGLSVPKTRNPKGRDFNSIRSQWERRVSGSDSQQPLNTRTIITWNRARHNTTPVVGKPRETVRPDDTSRNAAPNEETTRPRRDNGRVQIEERQTDACGSTAGTLDGAVDQEAPNQGESSNSLEFLTRCSEQGPIRSASLHNSSVLRQLKAISEQDNSEAQTQLSYERRRNKTAEAALQSRNEAALAAKEKEYAASLANLQQQHTDDLAGQQQVLDARLADKQKELEDALALHREQLSTRLASQQREHCIALATAQSNFAAALEAKQTAFDAKMCAKAADFDQQLLSKEMRFRTVQGVASRYKERYQDLEKEMKKLSDEVRDVTLGMNECKGTIRRLRLVSGNVITRRTILMARMAAVSDEMVFESRVAGEIAAKVGEGKDFSDVEKELYKAARRTTCPEDAIGMDDVLNIDEAVAYALSLDGQGAESETTMPTSSCELKRCDCCGRHKFRGGSVGMDPEGAGTGENKFDEFADLPAGVMGCGCVICSSCFRRWSALSADKNAWEDYAWSPTPNATVAPCPNPKCGSTLDGEEVVVLLNAISCPKNDIERNALNFSRSKAIRTLLQQLSLPASSLEGGRNLYLALRKHGIMSSLLDIPLESASPPPINDSILKLVNLEPNPVDDCLSSRTTIQAPLLLSCLRRNSEPRTCVVCSEDFYDLDTGAGGTEVSWRDVCATAGLGDGGSWISELCPFPSRSTLSGCEHDIDTCRNCYTGSIAAQLDIGGREAVTRILCPSMGCDRVLGYEAVKELASNETFAKYDRYLLLILLSNDENFTWCLRPGCPSGQIVEDHDRNPSILCEECNFRMCFRHQMAWHYGLSCAQYESARNHGGDPEYEETMRWIQSNSKACPGPGCGIRIQKGEACFHMTCSSCRFQFCWLCLADWTLICPPGRSYNQNAHAEGCYFRTSRCQPTALSGRTLEEALSFIR